MTIKERMQRVAEEARAARQIAEKTAAGLTSSQSDLLALIEEDARLFPKSHREEGHPLPVGTDPDDVQALVNLGVAEVVDQGLRFKRV